MFSKFFSFENPTVLRNKMQIYYTAGQDTNANMAHAHCVLVA
jgi:hypothetical protein